MLQNPEGMKRQLSIAEGLVAIAALAGSMLAAYVNIRVTDREQDIRIQQLESQRTEFNMSIRNLNDKLDLMQTTQTQILIELQNKKDRPK